MLTRTLLVVLPFVVLAFGGPLIGRNPQCNTGSLQCCNSVQSADDEDTGKLLNLLAIPMSGTGQVGMNCNPIPIGGAGSGAQCEQNPVCCSGTSHYNGFINMGCDPINIGMPL
ncbi:hypothetical protein HYDPIDRAFT_29205 [Hydnomerulius pinastri MD-312]|uniref:Hydrophobin n=1 Tax=Hydnomerulius pinastri MD-312 TaxID=994086 RepID=A0A0C9WF29_9AGAM|nr:hypothetical protein HYDPIDRAFT_29205 [Hydnomerulius pinastri MD-312]